LAARELAEMKKESEIRMAQTSPPKIASKSTKAATPKKTPASSKTVGKASRRSDKPRRRRRPEEVRSKVLDAALHCFSISGFEGTSVRSIASDAGVSLSLLLYHFESKENLWRAVFEDLAENYSISRSSYVNEENIDPKERLRRAIRETVEAFSEKPQLHRFMTMEANRPTPRLAIICDLLARKDFDFICQLILEAQRTGAVRPGNPGRLRYAIISIAAVPFAVAAEYEYLTHRNPFTQNEIERTIELIEALVFV